MPSVRRAWGILAGLSLLLAGFIAYAFAPASVLPLFVADFGIDKPAASAAISAVYLTWALLQLPGGYVLDRLDIRRLIIGGTIAFVVASLGGLLVDSYALLLGTRLVSGASAVFIFVGSVTVLGRVLPESRRALGLSLFMASPPLGIAVAQFAGPLIAIPYGWRTSVLAYTLVSAAGLLVFVALHREPITATDRITIRQFATAIGKPAVFLVSIASFCTYSIWTFLNSWMPTYGNEVLGIELAAAGAATALIPIAGMVARPGGGWLADRLHGRLRAVMGFSFVSSILLLFGLNAAPTPVAYAGLLALTGAAVNLGVGLYLVSVNRLSDTATRGTSFSVLVTTSNVGNLAAPVLGGWIIVQFSWTVGFGFAVGLAVAGLVAILLVPLAQ